MSIESVKALNLQEVIEQETGLRFKRKVLQHCPFCNSGNHSRKNSDSAFKVKENYSGGYFYCFSCGAGGSILDFVMKLYSVELHDAINYLEQKYLGMINNVQSVAQPLISKVIRKEQPKPDYIPNEWVEKSMSNSNQNNLVSWLKQQYREEKAQEAINLYKVGTSKHWKGATVFFNIDEEQLVRRGKVMLYDSETGKRNRKVHPTSVHSIMKLNEKPDSCLFGLHLRDTYPSRIVGIVESEKTAVIMSIIFPDYLWMATGGLSFLNPQQFKPLNRRQIILFPDLGEAKSELGTPYEQWSRKLPEIRKQVNQAEISELLERKCTPEQRASGFDIADYFTG